MKQISISSMVLNNHLTLNCDDLGEIKKLELQLVEQTIAFWSISENNLTLLCNELEGIIDNLIAVKLEFNEKHNTEIEYKKHIYKLDFRNKNHFYISALVSVYNMATVTKEHKSHLYIFNKSLLNVYNSESIVAYLRVHNWITKEHLYSGINQLWRNLKSDNVIDQETLQKGLDYLIFYGLIYKDERNEFSVTAVGYMYW